MSCDLIYNIVLSSTYLIKCMITRLSAHGDKRGLISQHFQRSIIHVRPYNDKIQILDWTITKKGALGGEGDAKR